jgi:hypothetical protein
LNGQFALAEAEMSHATPVQPVGLSPCILAIRLFGAVERVAGILEGLVGVAGREDRFGERQAEVDGVFPEAAGVRQEDAGLAFHDGLRVIAEVTLKFAGGVEAPELEFDVAGAGGEGTCVLQTFCGQDGVVGEEESSEEGITAAYGVVQVNRERMVPIGFRLSA